MSDGSRLIVRAAVKPTSSIAIPQKKIGKRDRGHSFYNNDCVGNDYRVVSSVDDDFGILMRSRCCRSYDRDHAYRSSSAEYDSEDGSFKTNLYKRNLGGRYV